MRRALILPLFAAMLSTVFAAAACSDSDEPKPTATASTAASPSPSASVPGATLTATASATTAASPSPSATASGPRAITGIFEEPRDNPATTKLTPPAGGAPTFQPVPSSNVVLFDIAAKKATDLGPGTLPSWAPASNKLAWVATTQIQGEGDVKVMDFADGLSKTVAKGRAVRFLDADHVTFFPSGNDKVSLDLKTGATVRIDGAADDQAYFGRLDAARMTTPDGLRLTRTDDPKAVQLPRGAVGSAVYRLTDTRTNAVVLEFRAFWALPAGKGTIVVASPVSAQVDRTNLFLVDVATARAEFIASTRWSYPMSLAADDSRVIWDDGFCSPTAGNVFAYERSTKKLIEVDTGGKVWWLNLTPTGQVAVGEFGAKTLLDPTTFATVVSLPERTGPLMGGDIAWSPDYRYAAYGISGGHGGLC